MAFNRMANIAKMINGDKTAIKTSLSSDSACVRMDAILWSAYHKLTDSDIISRINDLKNDQNTALGYSVGNYAIAALDTIGIEAYRGNDYAQKELNLYFVPTKAQAEEILKTAQQ